MTTPWSASTISSLLQSAFSPTISTAPTDAPPPSTIDVLLTFDASGVSAHPNHTSLHAGARAFLSALMRRHAGWACPVQVYCLSTVGLVRKYASVFDAVMTMAA